MQSKRIRLWQAGLHIGVFSLATNMLLLTMPLYMLQVYDRILPSSSINTLVYLSIIAAAALGLLPVLELVRRVFASRVAMKLDVANSRLAFQAAMNSPRASLGDIQPMRDLTTVRAFIASRSVFVIFDLPFSPLFIVLLWFVHPYLFWLTAGGAAFLVMP